MQLNGLVVVQKVYFFRSGYNAYNCSILTYDHLGDGFCDGLSINGWDGISFCTGSNARQERMRITNAGNVSCTGSIGCVGIYASGTGIIGNYLGVGNAIPWLELNLGNVDVGGSSGSMAFGKNNGGGGIRQFRQGYSSNFFFCLGDCGNVNSG